MQKSKSKIKPQVKKEVKPKSKSKPKEKKIVKPKEPQIKFNLRERKIEEFGWVPDIPDKRDKYVERDLPSLTISTGLPTNVDLRAQCPTTIYDQGDLGSCTANAIACLVEFDQMKENAEDFIPSRLFIYYCERVIERTIGYDSGASLRDGMKAINRQGAPHEKLWPYKISKFKSKPSPASFQDGLLHQAIVYARVRQNLHAMKTVLAAGFPFCFGFAVYESFESEEVTKTGVIPMPNTKEEAMIGGHAAVVVGFNDEKQQFICRNSWGAEWGDAGYFHMPYDYLKDEDMVADLWVVKQMEGTGSP